MNHFPPVSCVCPTFGRVGLLEEALHSFLKQNYRGKKQIVIINDFDKQTLIFKHPEVKIINMKNRVPNMGEKRNLTVKHADYNIIACWDSDDIYLPHSLTTRIKFMDNEFIKFPND